MANTPPTPSVCIVVPCYRAALRPFEDVALRQCIKLLSGYDTFFIKPASLDLSAVAAQYGISRIESFADRFFDGVPGYNQLMLADEFYARFAQYDYMLIYQLDAFVFRDDLAAWCAAGYDYVGAPWLPRGRPAPTFGQSVYAQLRQLAYRWANVVDATSQSAHAAQYMYAVGNGGLSLRRIAKIRAVLKAMPDKVEQYARIDGKTHHEDLFFSIEANRYLPRLKVPSFREAAGFAWEQQPNVAREINKGQLPFGCHGWNKLHADEWRPIFASLGHSLDDLVR